MLGPNINKPGIWGKLRMGIVEIVQHFLGHSAIRQQVKMIKCIRFYFIRGFNMQFINELRNNNI